MQHLEYMQGVADEDVRELRRKEATYKGSWKKRGGVGTFMMMARKWDRLEPMAKERAYDVFAEPGDGSDGTLIAEIRDLRRYLILVEAELQARGLCQGVRVRTVSGPYTEHTRTVVGHYSEPTDERAFKEVSKPGTPEDGGQHASLWPWIVTVNMKVTRSDVGAVPGYFDVWYRRLSVERWVLEPFVDESASIPDELRSIYKSYPQGWVIDLSQCPPEIRVHFPVLQEEVNNFELSQLPSWQRTLYDWHSDADKYIVRHREWCELEEAA
jgi:hypothetical protein